MKRRMFQSPGAVVLLLSILILGAGCSGLGGNATFSMQEGARSAQELLRETGAPSVSVALVDDGVVQWARGFGAIDAKAGRAPTPETMYGIGSTSKVIAAAAIMILVDRGTVSLDVPVAAYLPDFRMESPEASEITVRMLLNHSSGFPGTEGRGLATTVRFEGYADAMVETLAKSRLKHAPGAMSIYCNDGFMLLEKIVSAVTPKSYEAFVQDEIFAPLGMTNSRFPTGPFDEGGYAPAFREDGETPRPQEYNNTFASGGAYSTPSDLCRLLAMFANGGELDGKRILSEESVRAMAEDQTIGTFRVVDTENARYGLGWDTVREGGLESAGRTAWMKGGQTRIYGSCIIVIPELKLGAAVTGVSGIESEQAAALAERVLLAALVERGLLDAMPEELPSDPKEPAPMPDLSAFIPGLYANSGMLARLAADADGKLSIEKRVNGEWIPSRTGLAYRANGRFSTGEAPNEEYAFTAAGGIRYLVMSRPSTSRCYQEHLVFAQKVEPGAATDAPWEGRVARTWLVANETRFDYDLGTSWNPRLKLDASPEAPSALFVLPQGAGSLLVRPQTGDLAVMGLTIPTALGRDQNDLVVMDIGGEEWMRYGSYRYRPLETVPVLSADVARDIEIGPAGDGEWLRLDPGVSGATLTVAPEADSFRWILFDANFAGVADSGARGTGPLAQAPQGGYLHLMGDAGARFTVTLTTAETE
jgi:CubicO group peptidase (beta-lactamase class C family)